MRLAYLWSKFIKRMHGKALINCHIHKTSRIGPSCNMVNVNMGKYSYYGHDGQCVNCDIGSFCSISDNVFIGGAEHNMNWISTSPVFQTESFNQQKLSLGGEVNEGKKTVIENDVWIGHGVIIKQGVRVSNGAVIGAGAVVTKDIPPYAIVAGVPAKIIRYRFSNDVINKLLQTNWWDWDEQKIVKMGKSVCSPELFLVCI